MDTAFRERLMTGMCGLAGAGSFWFSAPAGGQGGHRFHQIGTLDEIETARAIRPLVRETADRRDRFPVIIPEAELEASLAGPWWKSLGMGQLILSCGADACGLVAVGFYRDAAGARFSRREGALIRLMLLEIGGWYRGPGIPEQCSFPCSVPPRCRMVLSHLLAGWPRKRIAEEMGLSVHTVNDHIKRLFAYFGVRSTPELIARSRKEGAIPPTFGE